MTVTRSGEIRVVARSAPFGERTVYRFSGSRVDVVAVKPQRRTVIVRGVKGGLWDLMGTPPLSVAFGEGKNHRAYPLVEQPSGDFLCVVDADGKGRKRIKRKNARWIIEGAAALRVREAFGGEGT